MFYVLKNTRFSLKLHLIGIQNSHFYTSPLVLEGRTPLTRAPIERTRKKDLKLSQF